jgi:3-deoxy-D-manno-oct-2-ulosonic acid (Kdo) hydroxylase
MRECHTHNSIESCFLVLLPGEEHHRLNKVYNEVFMNEVLEVMDLESVDAPISSEMQQMAISSLEQGKVLYFPKLPFQMNLDEHRFLSPEKVDPKSKNISYDIRNHRLGGTICVDQEAEQLKTMVRRYAIESRQLVERLFPSYTPYLNQARTSFRPVETAGRVTSYRKDDTLLHVDSFPANPVKGQRIMRVFTNINHEDRSRVWKLGEPFTDVAKKFASGLRKPLPGSSFVLKTLKITKDYRSLYDHYMLRIHDSMKGDTQYQKNVIQYEIHFPSGSTWIAFTDQVSHAAISGQHLLEQTFHLPVHALQNEETSPLRVLETLFKRKLV